MGIHAGRIERSPRLQRVYELLSDRQEHSTLQIVMEGKVCAVNAIIAELRSNGCEIECRQTVDTAGAKVWLYRMTRGVKR